jgi:putative transposase
LELFIQEKKLERKRKRKGGRSRTMAGGIFPDANWPLEIVQIDHTPLDIIIVDDENREAIGKPYLSIAIDVYSRMVVGFSVSLDPPSIFSVGELIGHCMLPKNDFLKQVGVNAEYDIYGLISMLHLDNAGEFRSEDFIPFEEEYMVGIRWRPVATPEYGGHIERLAKTLNDYVHQEPGSTMGDVIRRAGYDSEGKACYTIDEIEKWLTILITKIYHVKKHSKLTDRDGHQLSPIEKYKIGILGDDINPGIGNPDVIEDPERLKLFLLPSFERTVQREGIELEKIQYFHDILRNLYGEKGEDGKARKYLIKRNPRRINPINIFDPYQKEFFPIPYRDRTRPPMSVWDLNASKKRCKEKGINDPKEEQIFAAFAELRQIRDESVARTRSARRERDAEKRRNKMIPDAKPEQVTESWMAEESKDFNDEDIASLYDDPSLLTGVMVKSTER